MLLSMVAGFKTRTIGYPRHTKTCHGIYVGSIFKSSLFPISTKVNQNVQKGSLVRLVYILVKSWIWLFFNDLKYFQSLHNIKYTQNP